MVYAGGMDCEIGTDAEAKRLVLAALSGQLTDQQAEALAALDQDLLKLALLVMAKQIAEQRRRLRHDHQGDDGPKDPICWRAAPFDDHNTESGSARAAP